MEIRPSGKIAIGSVVALGTIGLLHIMIFKNSAALYQQKKDEFQNTYREHQEQGRPPRFEEINQFRYSTLKEKIAYWTAASQLRIFLPDFYAPGAGVDPLRAHQDALWDFMRKLQELAAQGAAGEGPKLSFTGSRGWNLVDNIPEELIRRNIAVEDELTKLRNEDRLLNSLDPQSDAFLRRSQSYDVLLLRLGLDVNYRKNLKQFLGGVAATVYTLNRIDQVMKRLPEDFFSGAEREDKNLQLDLMYHLFRIEWPVDGDGNPSPLLAQRQAEAVLDLIEKAKVVGQNRATNERIDDITYVKMHDFRKLLWKAFDPNAVAATPEPAAAAMAMDWGMDFGGEMGGDGGFDRFGGDSMGGGGGGAVAAAPVDDGELVGNSSPIEVYVTGQNSAVTSLLFELSYNRTPYELDRLRLRTVNAAEGKVEARAFFNVIAYANMVGLNTTTDIQRKIIDYTIELMDLATRPGSNELALKDGLVQERDGRLQLINPPPTPMPTPEGQTPTPDPAAMPVEPDMNAM